MTESLTTAKENIIRVNYSGGSVEAELIGNPEASEGNPVIVIPGYGRGRIAYHGLAEAINQSGSRAVLVLDQPKWSKASSLKLGKAGSLPAVDHQAEALLVMMVRSGFLDGQPIDFVAHSFGAVVLERAAHLAGERGMNMGAFDHEKGSHTVFIGPAGTIANDSLKKLRARFKHHIEQSIANQRRGNSNFVEIHEENTRLSKKTPKSIGEALALGKARISYRDLGKYGIKPHVVFLPKDVVAPDELMWPTIEANQEQIASYTSPITPDGTHDEIVFAPQRVADTVLQLLGQ